MVIAPPTRSVGYWMTHIFQEWNTHIYQLDSVIVPIQNSQKIGGPTSPPEDPHSPGCGRAHSGGHREHLEIQGAKNCLIVPSHKHRDPMGWLGGWEDIPLVNIQKNYGKSQCLMGKSPISTGSFSIAMLNYQRVNLFSMMVKSPLIPIYMWFSHIFSLRYYIHTK